MIEEDLKEIRERINEASSGPWRWSSYCSDNPRPKWIYVSGLYQERAPWLWIIGQRPKNKRGDQLYGGIYLREADAKFILSAREDAQKLLQEVDRLQAENAKLRKALGFYADQGDDKGQKAREALEEQK